MKHSLPPEMRARTHSNLIVVAFGMMLLGVLGVISLWMAVFSDVGVCFLAILNAMRAMRVEK